MTVIDLKGSQIGIVKKLLTRLQKARLLPKDRRRHNEEFIHNIKSAWKVINKDKRINIYIAIGHSPQGFFVEPRPVSKVGDRIYCITENDQAKGFLIELLRKYEYISKDPTEEAEDAYEQLLVTYNYKYNKGD